MYSLINLILYTICVHEHIRHINISTCTMGILRSSCLSLGVSIWYIYEYYIRNWWWTGKECGRNQLTADTSSGSSKP